MKYLKHLPAMMLLAGAAALAVLFAGGVAKGADAAPEAAASIAFPGHAPGESQVAATVNSAELSNDALAAAWTWAGGRLTPLSLLNKLSNVRLPAPDEAFSLEFRDGKVLRASDFKVQWARTETLEGNAKAVGLAERCAGRQVSALLAANNGAIEVEWSASLRNGANYVRQQVKIRSLRGEADIAKVVLVSHELPGADVVGQVPGSPIVAGSFFTGFEHPMSSSRVDTAKIVPDPAAVEGNLSADHIPDPQATPLHTHATAWLNLALPIQEGKTFTAGSVQGVVPEGQLRRGVLYYVERERAHPYRTFLHYNSWYDIGYFTPYDRERLPGLDRRDSPRNWSRSGA